MLIVNYCHMMKPVVGTDHVPFSRIMSHRPTCITLLIHDSLSVSWQNNVPWRLM